MSFNVLSDTEKWPAYTTSYANDMNRPVTGRSSTCHCVYSYRFKTNSRNVRVFVKNLEEPEIVEHIFEDNWFCVCLEMAA